MTLPCRVRDTGGMRKMLFGCVLVLAGYVAGTLAPHASASDAATAIVSELRGIKGELAQIRRAIERGK